MRIMRVSLALCLITALIVFMVPLLASGKAGDAEFAPDQILVKFKAGTVDNAKNKVHAKHGGQVIGEIEAIGVQVVKVPSGKVLDKVTAYGGEDAVAFAEPDYMVEAAGYPDDTYFAKQWGMTKIKAPEAWDITSGSAAVNIAILDSGIYREHPDLTGKVVESANFTRSKTVDDRYGHGTHVAGIAAALTDNGLGVAGVAYGCNLLNVKVLGDNGRGSYSALIEGINWAVSRGANVINMSLSGQADSEALQDAVNKAWAGGVVLVAAAGNYGDTTLQYPACYENVIGVAAVDENDAKTSWSSYGDWVDVAAPGLDIYSTIFSKRKVKGSTLEYVYASGTSMAAPHVAGVAALVYGRVTDTSENGCLNDEIRARIEAMADRVGEIWTIHAIPRINALNAVRGNVLSE